MVVAFLPLDRIKPGQNANDFTGSNPGSSGAAASKAVSF
jgi:hypothetical protein